jgi:hypothetical protein
MNNVQKITAAVIVFGLLGLGACVSSMPNASKKGDCISTQGWPTPSPPPNSCE